MSITVGNMLIPLQDEASIDEEMSNPDIIDQRYIIILVNPITNTVYLINAEGKPKKPICINLTIIEEGIKNKQLNISTVTYSYHSMLDDQEIDKKWLAIRDKRLEIIQDIIEDDISIENFLNASRTNPVVKTISKEKKCSRESIYKFVYTYFQGGRRKNSLLPRFDKIGRSSTSKTKVGAKIDGKSIGIPATDDVKENIRNALNKYYKNKKKQTYQHAYNKMCDDHYSEQVYNEKTGGYDTVHYDDNKKPSINQFKYWARKLLDPVEASKKRLGVSQHEKDFKPILSSSDYFIRGPGEKYEIDATIGDIYLVSAFDRTRTTLIGRPVIYLVTDVYSRCIVGLYVGLEGPSWDGARAALYNAFRNKVEFCAEFGIEITEDDWPCHHVCVEIFADRGEMISKNAEALLNNIGVRNAGFAGPYRGDLKGLVEQYFNVLNKRTLEHLPGNNVKIKRTRGERKPELDAALTIKELTQIIINDIIDYNKYKVKNVVGNIEMIKDSITPTPLNLWNWGMEFGIGCVNTIDQNNLYLGLLPSGKATVRGDGIYFNSLRYSSEIAIKNGWHSKVRMKGKYFKVDIRYTKSTTNFIWIINPENHQPQLCRLNDTVEKFKNLQHDEYLDQLERTNKAIREANRVRTRAETKTRQTNEQIIANAESEKKNGKTTTKNIRKNRSKEKSYERKKDTEKALEASGLETNNNKGKKRKRNIPDNKLKSDTQDFLDDLLE